MNVQSVLGNLPVTVVAGNDFSQTITGGYVSDLLSNVMGQAAAGNVWITMQGHQNIVAVASLVGMSGIIVAGGASVDNETVNRAQAENIPILRTGLSTYAVAGRLYACGIQAEA